MLEAIEEVEKLGDCVWANDAAVTDALAAFDPKSVLHHGLRSTRNLPFIQHLIFG